VPSLLVFDELGDVEVRRLSIPHDCSDGFLAAFWRRPGTYLDSAVQANIAALVALDRRTAETLDAGYRIVVCTLR
jgi:hypothetical protein